MRCPRGLIVLFALVVSAAPAGAKPADDVLAEVLRGTRSSAERAVKLLAAAKLVTDDAPGMVAILVKAVEFGLQAPRDPKALQATAEALDLLDRKAPDRKGEWDGKRLELSRRGFRFAGRTDKAKAGREFLHMLMKQAEDAERARQWGRAKDLYAEGYAAAGAIASPLREWMGFQRLRGQHFETVAGRIEVEKRKLANGRSDLAAREKAIELLIVEMDDPAGAAGLVTADVDQAWRTYVPLAGRDPNKLEESAAAELGRWYHKFLLPKASKFSDLRLLVRARSCLQRAVVLHEAKDAALVPLRLQLAEVEKQLEEIIMDPTVGGRGADVDLLRSLDIDRTDWKGAWDFVNRALTVWPREGGHLRVPATVTGDYRLSLRFANRFGTPIADTLGKYRGLKVSRRVKARLTGAKLSDKGGMDLAFPVGRKNVCLTLDPGRTETVATLHVIETDPEDRKQPPVGFEPLGTYDAKAEAVVAKAPPLPTERLHQVDVAVFVEGGVAVITIYLNGEPLIRWRGKAERCFLTDRWPMGNFPGQFLLGGWTGPSVFAAASVFPFAGHAELVPFEEDDEP